MWPPQRSSIWPGPGHLANGQPPQQHQPQRVPQHHLHQPCMPPYGGGGAGAASPYQPPLLPDPTWQDVVLEQQFSHMSFRQPPPIFQQPPRPSTQATTTQQPQPLAHLSNNTPMTMSSAVPASNGGGGIPSLLDIRVPRPPHLNNSYSRPPPPQAIPPPMAVFPHPMINTSVPPPRITVLQKPPRLAQRPVPVPSPSKYNKGCGGQKIFCLRLYMLNSFNQNDITDLSLKETHVFYRSDCSNSPNFVQANKIGVSAKPLRPQWRW